MLKRVDRGFEGDVNNSYNYQGNMSEWKVELGGGDVKEFGYPLAYSFKAMLPEAVW